MGRARTFLFSWLAIAALSSMLIVGEHHADELGQISAFYLLKAGYMDVDAMPWEYPERMRPWLQPAMYYLLLGGFVDAGAVDGYAYLPHERVMLLIQLLLLAAAVWLLRPLLLAAPLEGKRQRLASAAWALLWFAPAMLVRHSSEAFATALWTASIALWWRIERGDQRGAELGTISGLLAGLSVFGRFQVGLLVAPFWLVRWCDRDKRPTGALWGFAAGVVAATAMGVAVDIWGYGEPVFTPWRYLSVNLLEGRASTFGTTPWHAYLGEVVALTLNPLIVAWLAWASWVTRREPFYRSLSAGMLVFLLVHLAVPHKEARFLLPLFAPATLLFLHAFALLRDHDATGAQRWLFSQPYLRFVIVLNVVALAGYTAFGLVSDRGRVEQALWRLPHRPQVVLSATNLFGHFDAHLLAAPNAGHEREEYRSFIEPPWVRYVYVPPQQLERACDAHPGALLLRTNHEQGPDGVIRTHPEELRDDGDSAAVIAEFPPDWLQTDAEWFARMWRYTLLRCATLDGD